MDKMEQGSTSARNRRRALQIRKRFRTVYIFILPPSMETLRAGQSRASDTPEEIQRRLQKVKEEVWSFREYYYIVRNDNLEQSLKELQSVFLAERLKTKRLDMHWLEQNFILEKESKPGDRDQSSIAKGSTAHHD
jgi:guanylate kinase